MICSDCGGDIAGYTALGFVTPVEHDCPSKKHPYLARAERAEARVAELEAKLSSSPPSSGIGAMTISVQPEWCRALPLQQQSVLFLAGRGPDGIEKHHTCKLVHVAYRATIFLAGKYGRSLAWGERADNFMSLDLFANPDAWRAAVEDFFRAWDTLPAHYVKHLMHGVEILGFKHPDPRFRERWGALYLRFAEEFHVNPETEAQMDRRLGDWERKHWAAPSSEEPTP